MPNGSLMFNRDGTGFIQVFGDAGFPASIDYLTSVGIRLDTALPAGIGKTLPGDGTLLREFNTPQVFVVFGGAKFPIPDPVTLAHLGYDAGQVGVVPPSGLAQVGTVPLDGTLLKEPSKPDMFLVENGKLRLITSPAALTMHFLPWRYVRIIPDGTLPALDRGPDLGP